MLTTSAAADKLHAAAKVARSGASDLYTARARMGYAVDDARTAGFDVAEDLSITDRFSGGSPVQRAARQAQAETLVGNIRQRAALLVGLDHQVYPVNQVIAEATDLDGNRVLLRRGYYDEKMQQGFGWDKAFWRHHVVNPNVFKDLISHSRPISNKDGTLVYEVPINRVHCTSGPLGISDCEDTGESLSMRIVANINEGRAGIPDGGQKGVISMYPLEGGSGVVEVEPGWTLCPPWVNKNVPIN
jgi:hypothetical protein